MTSPVAAARFCTPFLRCCELIVSSCASARINPSCVFFCRTSPHPGGVADVESKLSSDYCDLNRCWHRKVAAGDLKTSISEASRTTRAGCRNATAVGVRGNPDRRVAITERPAVTLQVQNPDPSTYERVQGVLVRLQ
jgi:hypothetical protein